MKRPGLRRALLALSMTLLLVVLGTGCTKYASEDDLQNLERQKQAALSAEKKVDQLKGDKAAAQKQLAQKQQDLQKAQAEKATVAQRMQSTQMMMPDSSKMMNKDNNGMGGQ